MKTQQIPEQLIPDNDTQRLKILYQYEILDTPPETDFDTIAQLAAQIFNTTDAFVTFVDKDQVFYKAKVGSLEGERIARENDLCALCISTNDVAIFHDTHQFPELLKAPYVNIKDGIRFYAAAPIKTADGFILGAVCVASEQPRQTVSDTQIEMLKLLSKVVMEKLDTRLVNRKIVRAYDDRLHRLAHDMKNPVTSISLYAQLLGTRVMDPEKIKDMSSRIEKAAKGIEKNLDQLLTNARSENSGTSLVHEQIWIGGLLDQLRQSFELTLASKNQTLIITPAIPEVAIAADEIRIMDILSNLLGNAVKYSDPGTKIYISAEVSSENQIILEFRDQGQGLTETDQEKLFIKFARLSSTPTAREKSYGLGLSIVKMLAESHKGNVWATSEGKGKGSSFFVSFPISQTGE
ncbi:hypothetical protein N180_13635 [Pedobacter antarcticus 4BY]|uniref:histidine kinase n=2 Tax=Pedobacter antarcticus TaxID=34086 RepID=A0A081PE70_9SPHI|nr:GAF domain-containing sensor histidine kinase [Pedobacter antarcticus]KEQ28993.1 hypothetical protein N180_13635 [Pedobacter antarcticus 4BY]SFF45908.1 GAF domain-containing protein [Pedobacter antarcticus]